MKKCAGWFCIALAAAGLLWGALMALNPKGMQARVFFERGDSFFEDFFSVNEVLGVDFHLFLPLAGHLVNGFPGAALNLFPGILSLFLALESLSETPDAVIPRICPISFTEYPSK